MALEVHSVSASADSIRSSGSVTVMFMVPENDDAGTDSLENGFAALHLPAMWGMGMTFKSCPTSASLALHNVDDDGVSDGTTTDITGAVDGCSGNTVYVTLGDSYTWTDGSNYTLTVSGVPTPEYDFTTATCGDVLVSIGSTDSGSYAWSDA